MKGKDNGIEAKEWNLLPHDSKMAMREAYASQFGKSWVTTSLSIRRRRGITYVWIRLRPASGKKGKVK